MPARGHGFVIGFGGHRPVERVQCLLRLAVHEVNQAKLITRFRFGHPFKATVGKVGQQIFRRIEEIEFNQSPDELALNLVANRTAGNEVAEFLKQRKLV